MRVTMKVTTKESHNKMKCRERDIEKVLVREIEKQGGWAVKLSAQWIAGIPDRLILLPKGKVFFVELKAPGESPRPIQIRRAEQLRALGFKVYVIDSKEQIKALKSHIGNEVVGK